MNMSRWLLYLLLSGIILTGYSCKSTEKASKLRKTNLNELLERLESMTQDSFWILYRFDDIYEAGSFDELMDYYKIGLSFDDFQDLIVGNFYVPKPDQVQSLHSEALHILDFRRGVNRYQYGIDGDFMIRKMLVSDPYGRTVIVTMDDFNEEGIAQSKDCQILWEDGQTATVSIDLNDIEFDVPKTIKFDIPQHYTRLP